MLLQISRMKTPEELREFYERELLPDLTVLERRRRRIVGGIVLTEIAEIGIIAGAVVFLFFKYKGLDRSEYLDLVMNVYYFLPALLVIGFINIMAFRGIRKAFTTDFKTYIIARLVRFVDEGLNYSQNRKISEVDFTRSQIFGGRPGVYNGDDLVYGTIGKTRVEFSEVHADRKESWSPIPEDCALFHGLFFIGEFNKHFNCRVVILPDIYATFPGEIGRKLEGFGRDERLRLEDVEFEKYFAAYSNDQVEARYILSTSLMERIVEFRKKTGRDVHISFVDSAVFLAISYTRKLFEPRLFRTIVDFEPVRQYYEDLALAVGIVDDLNLNRRIWSKR